MPMSCEAAPNQRPLQKKAGKTTLGGMGMGRHGQDAVMTKPQQPELRRNSLNPTDEDSAEINAGQSPPESEAPGPVPEANRPGHRPAKDQDKPPEVGGAGAHRPG